MFLGTIAKVVEMDTRKILLGHPRKFQSVYDEARRSVRKCVKGK